MDCESGLDSQRIKVVLPGDVVKQEYYVRYSNVDGEEFTVQQEKERLLQHFNLPGPYNKYVMGVHTANGDITLSDDEPIVNYHDDLNVGRDNVFIHVDCDTGIRKIRENMEEEAGRDSIDVWVTFQGHEERRKCTLHYCSHNGHEYKVREEKARILRESMNIHQADVYVMVLVSRDASGEEKEMDDNTAVINYNDDLQVSDIMIKVEEEEHTSSDLVQWLEKLYFSPLYKIPSVT